LENGASEIWIFPPFLAIFRGHTKILETWIFPRCLGILKDGLIQKFFAGFPQSTDFEIRIFRGFPQFLGDPKNSQNADISAISWDFEGRAHPKNFGTRTFPQFSWDLKVQTHQKN
jgi:hypothetical protein